MKIVGETLIVVALCFGNIVLAQTQQNAGISAAEKNNMADAVFAKKAAAGGMAEVKMGQLAQEKGSADAVKQFGQRMIVDHRKANDELKTLAQQESIVLPSGLDARGQAAYDRLSKLSGPTFDRAYARQMVNDHKMDIANFHGEASGGKNLHLKNFAAEILPTLHDHLGRAQAMMMAVSGNDTTSQNR